MIGVNANTIIIDKGMKKALASLSNSNNCYVKVGYPRSKSTPHSNTGMDIADLAILMEHGQERTKDQYAIPPRPFMKQTFDRNKPEAKKKMKMAYDLVVKGADPLQSLKVVGEWYKGRVEDIFLTGDFEPNAKLTIYLKQSSRPLIDTGELRQSVKTEYRRGTL